MKTGNRISITKVFLLICLFFALMTVFRIIWITSNQPEHLFEAEDGVIDLTDQTLTNRETVLINGEWEFEPGAFIDPSDPTTSLRSVQDVPMDWTEGMDENAYGFGTYRLKIVLPAEAKGAYGLRFNSVSSAADIYVNGELVASSGKPGETAEVASGDYAPLSQSFYTTEKEIDLVIHLSNFDIPFWGGISESVEFGTQEAVLRKTLSSHTLQIAIAVLYFLHALYAIAVFWLGKGRYRKELFYYSLMLAISALAILLDDEVIWHLPMSVQMHYMLLFFIFTTTLIIMVTFVKYMLRLESRFYKWLVYLYAFISVIQWIVPFEYYALFLGVPAVGFYLSALVFLFFHTIRSITGGYRDGIFILLLLTSYTSNIVWGALIKLDVSTIPYYPFDFLLAVISIAFLLFKQHIDLAKLHEKQTNELHQHVKTKDEFLANTSHELRNPLHGIINIAQTVLDTDEGKLSADNRDNLNLLMRIGRRMTYMLNDLLDVSLLKNEDIRIEREPVSLHAVSIGVFDMLRFLTENKRLGFELRIPPSFPLLHADEKRLIQIMFNLLHNAVKYTDEGTISVEAERRGKMAIIYIKDTGTGMDGELMANVFEPYVQGAASPSGKGGIGLGLRICQKLIELHGGTITVKSTRGKGTVFSFTMPIADGEAFDEAGAEQVFLPTDERKEMPPTGKSCGARVFLVDDDPVNIRILSGMLSSEYTIGAATSGEEALEQLMNGKWDLVVSDVMMPEMSGYVLTENIRKRYTLSELPVLLLTARNQPEDVEAGFRSGANDYVAKPVDATELKWRVQALVKMKLAVEEQLVTEAAWLQAQIQPHFLFNTLNTIASLSEIDSDRMIRLLDEFGNYLVKSFDGNNTNMVVPLASELDLLHSYLYIELERFSDRLVIDWEVDPIDDAEVPPLSIQPLVENAVRHGVLKRLDGGKVTIRIAGKEEEILIEVKDDGVGMSEAQLARIFDDQLTGEGIGLKNTNRRLQKLYGKGLHITSGENVGTSITFTVPRSKSANMQEE